MKKYLLQGLGIVIILIMIGMAFIRSGQDQKIAQVESTNVNYTEYSEENLTKAYEGERILLFFWASWCPTCRELDRELKERGSELPGDLTILRVNIDTEKDIKQQYNITQQHTLVQIDKQGIEITKWIGGNIDLIKQKLK